MGDKSLWMETSREEESIWYCDNEDIEFVHVLYCINFVLLSKI
jgi:hypothetical protein